ncbi:MAG: 2,3-bisphosphoglycerate-independent phosphoglycerate mutase [Candidatus Paceibacterota bacterium]
MISKKICLIIMDGWGIGEKNFSNPIHQAKIPNLEEIKKYYPMTTLQASGMAVGLPFNEAGNSEVGHLNLGTGQVLYQYSVRISQSIKNGSFFKNSVLLDAYNYVKEKKSTLHLIGLLSDNIVHSSYDHLIALIDLAGLTKINNVSLHLFTDGRDSPPTQAKELIQKLEEDLKIRGRGKIVTIAGRFYGMDRDKNYARTAKAYNAMVFGKGNKINNLKEYLENSYRQGITDEFIVPAVITDPKEGQPEQPEDIIKNNDAVIFFNFREERMRQIVEAFHYPNFNQFPIKSFKDLKIVAFTQYQKDFSFPVAFPIQKIDTCLSAILSANGKRQLRLAESEKYAHATYFFNGLKEKPFPGEYWVIIPSIKTLHLEKYPELKAREITTRLLQAFEENIYDFILVNYANPDLIGHTGNIEAGIKCAEIIDEQIGKVVKTGQNFGYTMIITSDHGNLEVMMNPLTAEKETEHNSSLVPFYLIEEKYKLQKNRSSEEIKEIESAAGGILSDVAPTILKLFGFEPPPEMTGQSLLPILGIY